MGKISRDCDKDVTTGKSWSSRRFLKEFVGYSWSKSSLDRLIRKDNCWITNWQFYWSRSYIRLSL